MQQPCPLCPELQPFEHARLQIDCDDPPGFAHHASQGNRKVTHPTADVSNPIAGLHKTNKDTFRFMEEAAKGIVESGQKPPGTYTPIDQDLIFIHLGPFLFQILLINLQPKRSLPDGSG
jgi:hypothetical protein